MSSVTSAGRETMATWLAATSTVVAPMRTRPAGFWIGPRRAVGGHFIRSSPSAAPADDEHHPQRRRERFEARASWIMRGHPAGGEPERITVSGSDPLQRSLRLTPHHSGYPAPRIVVAYE
jgi:hypothetical protein